ncbi:MAG: tRNA 2-thiouridine(34) synthase MnmA [Minisyncoccia bacterium]
MTVKQKKSQKVFVGMSGGVDSSVSAALLKKDGYDVTGVFIKVWQPDFVECTWREDRLDAMRVCAKLHIPFFTLDLEKEYKKEVADYMIDEYKKGKTPNPDVMCNKYVKFGAFFDWAIKQGADFVATGHYARASKVLEDSSSEYGLAAQREVNLKSRPRSSAPESGHLWPVSACEASKNELSSRTLPTQLLAGKDKNKDQSYFLWTLTQKQLQKTLFPIGNTEKPEVRKIAKKLGLSTAEKKDSQGVCFLGKFDMKDFLNHYIKECLGKVLNEKGEVVGSHNGAIFLTIGQRHGFKIIKKTNSSKPLFVIAKNLQKNTITVSENPVQDTGESKEIEIEKVSWTGGVDPDLSKRYFARIRYRQTLLPCKIKKSVGSVVISFEESQKAVSSGQSLVIYDGEVCLGGGIIK